MERRIHFPKRIKGQLEIQQQLDADGRRIFNLDNTIGKTISRIINLYKDIIIVMFADSTFTTLSIENHEYDEPAITSHEDLTATNYYEMGLISKEDLQSINDAKLSQQKDERRRTYKKLKKEFEP